MKNKALLNNTTVKKVALVATLAALAAVSRVPMAFIPSVQPTTFLVMIAGCVYGGRIGFTVGALAALVSNFFLGQGPWTPLQMLVWGLSGASAAFLTGGKRGFQPVTFTILAALWGYFFGWLMNIWHWAAFVYPLNWETFMAVNLVSFPFDTGHALGNIIFSLMFGKTFYNILLRYKKKIEVMELDQTRT